MKKIFTITVISLNVFLGLTYGQVVDENTAKKIGQSFLKINTKTGTDLELVYKAISKSTNALESNSDVYFYIFNTSTRDGFVIVSGNENTIPILGYSNESVFDQNDIPQNVTKWLEGYKEEIRYLIEEKIQSTEEILEQWKELKSGELKKTLVQRTKTVSPLIQTKWNQSPNYNALCPYDGVANDKTVTGCVATAMAQVMKFWNYPATGTGFHSYNHLKYGTLSANFGSTSYQWSAMPNQVNGANGAVATLMYHCGVSVDMSYGIDASSAYVISSSSPITNCSEYALKTYFGYKNTLQGIEKKNFSQDQWINLIKKELDAGRPMIYAGFGSGGGHCFVNDGYDNNNFFHFNWGWNGNSDGYFSIDALNPGGIGTGGGTGGFNSNHQAIIGIQPPSGIQTYNLDITTKVTASSSSIDYGSAFSVSCNITNKGTNTFNGDYCAAIFDNNGAFVDYVEIKSAVSLQAGYTYTSSLVFSNPGGFSFLPGTYNIYIFYRPTDENWKQIQASDILINDHVSVNIKNSNSIELNSIMTVTPGVTLTKGQPASINLNIVNNGSTSFIGQYGIGLFNLDGTLAQTIKIVYENTGLPPGFTYQSPYLTFSTSSVLVNPGTYLLAVQHNPNNTGWQLTGSTNFQNPIKVIVKEPILLPDQYETNNTVSESYTLPLTFVSDLATKNTTGTNLHIGSDYDYFKINLSLGYEYVIKARLHDSNNSGDGNVYTVDALFSYSLNGTTWSESYDYTPPGSISIHNGGMVYFHIAPYFTGETGTYLFGVEVSRKLITGLQERRISDLIKVYPNPASKSVFIDLEEFSGVVRDITMIDSQGKKLISVDSQSQRRIEMSLNHFIDGLYLLQFNIGNRLVTKKILIEQ